MSEIKAKKKIPVIRILLLGLILYVAVKFVIGDGSDYNYVEDTAVYGTQEGNSIFEQNVLMGENGNLYVVYYSDRHTEAYKGNLESKEYIKQNHLKMYDMNVIGNIVYALEGAPNGDGYRLISFDLESPEKVKRLVSMANSEGNQVMYLNNLLVVDDACYFLCEGEDCHNNDDNMFISYNLTTGEKKIIDAPPIREYFIDNGTIYFINAKDLKLYSMPLEGGEATKLSLFKTINAFMYKGRIYYVGMTSFGDILMTMNPDGTNHKMHQLVNWNYFTITLADGKLYTYNRETISCMNVADGVSTEWEMNIREQVIAKITSYYVESIDTSISNEEIDINALELRVSNGYAYFLPECTIGETSIREAFIMDLETKEIYLLNEYLGIGPEVEYKPDIK